MKFAFLVLAALLAIVAMPAAAVQQCVCVSGCKVVSDAYVADSSVPTSCNVYKAGVQISTGTMVLSSSIPLSNASVCIPPDTAYAPGPSTNMSCIASIPGQPANTTVSLTVRGVNAAGEAPDGGVLTFQSVSALATLPPAKGARISP